jgi:transposase-like protein
MTRHDDLTLPESLLETIADQGLDALPQAFALLLNAAMRAERQKYLQAAPYERTPERIDQANGYKDKTLTTRVGAVTVAVPQVRNGDFYPSSLERGLRSERALKIALAEMYVQGVSTRRVAAITEAMCGVEISSSQVSRCAAELDVLLTAWRNRPLGVCVYLYLDARYESVRQNGSGQNLAVLIAIGITEEGKRCVLGVSVSLSEHEVHWRQFLKSLVERGLSGVQLVISDDHDGLKAAARSVLGGVAWQRCQCHLQRNAQAYVPKQEMKRQVAADIRAIFNAPDRQEAESLLKRTVEKYQKTAPKLADWMEANLPEGLTVFSFPESHRRLIRTTNGLERLNQEVRRRTRVARLFPNEASCLRLVSAVLMEISDDWETGKAYLTFTDE